MIPFYHLRDYIYEERTHQYADLRTGRKIRDIIDLN